jgi:hypothetical protein
MKKLAFIQIVSLFLLSFPFYPHEVQAIVAPATSCTIGSNVHTRIDTHTTGYTDSVLAYTVPAWTANIPGAQWIWSTYNTADPLVNSTVTFVQKFTATTTLSTLILTLAADNTVIVKVNGTTVASVFSSTYAAGTEYTQDIASYVTSGVNTITFDVTNEGLPGSIPETNPAGLLFSLDTTGTGCIVPNTAPSITLSGSNPLIFETNTPITTLGSTVLGYTASDIEDGNLTASVVVTTDANIAVPGTYTLTYTVTDSGGMTTTTTRPVIIASQVSRSCSVLSDIGTGIVGGGDAVLAYTVPAWTANIPGAQWISSTYKIVDPLATTTTSFKKYFYATSSQANLTVAADNMYTVKLNGFVIGSSTEEVNYSSGTEDVYALNLIPQSINTLEIDVVNVPFVGATDETNPIGLLYGITVVGGGCTPNTAPQVTLVGNNPFQLDLGTVFTDPGATATDTEDGNITAQIVVTGIVSTTTPGTYVVTYSITDAGGLTASTTRQVIVNTVNTTPAAPSGGSGGNGGGGNGPIVGAFGGAPSVPANTLPQVLGASISRDNDGLPASCSMYLYTFMKQGAKNDALEVKKLQTFLNEYLGLTIPVTGVFGPITKQAVNQFQLKESTEVLLPWVKAHLHASEKEPTGNVYKTTRRRINLIKCESLDIPMPFLP